MSPSYWPQATTELSQRDSVLRNLIGQYAGLALGSRGDAYQTLARAIVGQQISVKAAASVWDRLQTALGGITPASVGGAEAATLRACGLSARKVSYLHDLAQHFLGGMLDVGSWHARDDQELIEELTRVKGIGRWTAEMFLIFHMTRPDVLPVADIGLQRAMALHYNAGRPLSLRRLQSIGKRWIPWRSVATWYLWRSLDPIPVDY